MDEELVLGLGLILKGSIIHSSPPQRPCRDAGGQVEGELPPGVYQGAVVRMMGGCSGGGNEGMVLGRWGEGKGMRTIAGVRARCIMRDGVRGVGCSMMGG